MGPPHADPANRRFGAAQARLDKAISEVITQYRQQRNSRQDLLSQIMEGDDGSGRPPHDAEVRDQQ